MISPSLNTKIAFNGTIKLISIRNDAEKVEHLEQPIKETTTYDDLSTLNKLVRLICIDKCKFKVEYTGVTQPSEANKKDLSTRIWIGKSNIYITDTVKFSNKDNGGNTEIFNVTKRSIPYSNIPADLLGFFVKLANTENVEQKQEIINNKKKELCKETHYKKLSDIIIGFLNFLYNSIAKIFKAKNKDD